MSDEQEAWLTEASDCWWRPSDGCAPVTDAEDDDTGGLFGAPDTGWHYMTIDFQGYLVSPDGQTVIAVSDLDPVAQECEVALAKMQREIQEDVFKILSESPKVPFTDNGMELIKNAISKQAEPYLGDGGQFVVLEPTEEDKANRIIRWGYRRPATVTLTATIYEPIPTDQRYNTLSIIAVRLRDEGRTEVEILAELRETSAAACDPPLNDAELVKLAHTVFGPAPDKLTPETAERILDAVYNGDPEIPLGQPDPDPDFEGPCENHVCTEACIDDAVEIPVLATPLPDFIPYAQRRRRDEEAHGGLVLGLDGEDD